MIVHHNLIVMMMAMSHEMAWPSLRMIRVVMALQVALIVVGEDGISEV